MPVSPHDTDLPSPSLPRRDRLWLRLTHATVTVLALPMPLLRGTIAGVTWVLPMFLTGCISYTVGQGAETAPIGERTASSSVAWVPGTIGDRENRVRTTRPSLDSEVRFGVDEQTDIGFRVASYTGFMVTWKRQLNRPDVAAEPENRARMAVMLGAGLLNAAEHAGFEATLIGSSKWSSSGQWYGALRAIQVAPLSSTAKQDDPAVGISIGHLFGDQQSSFGPELGVYYDRSVLGLNSSRILVVPSFVLRRGGVARRGRRR